MTTNNSHLTPEAAAALEAHRKRDGKFGAHTNTAPDAALPTPTETEQRAEQAAKESSDAQMALHKANSEYMEAGIIALDALLRENYPDSKTAVLAYDSDFDGAEVTAVRAADGTDILDFGEAYELNETLNAFETWDDLRDGTGVHLDEDSFELIYAIEGDSTITAAEGNTRRQAAADEFIRAEREANLKGLNALTAAVAKDYPGSASVIIEFDDASRSATLAGIRDADDNDIAYEQDCHLDSFLGSFTDYETLRKYTPGVREHDDFGRFECRFGRNGI